MILVDIDECLFGNGGCEQMCINAQGSFSCGCRIGYDLSENGYTCKSETISFVKSLLTLLLLLFPQDIDECLSIDTHLCKHQCVDSVGSYFCYCNEGYELAIDYFTCIGKKLLLKL